MKEVCRLFKGMLLDAREEARRATALAEGAVGDSANAATSTDSNTVARSGALSRGDARGSDKSLLSSADAVYVGKPESRGGFSLGHAPDNAFPAVAPVASSSGAANSGNASASRSDGQRRSGGASDFTTANGATASTTTAVAVPQSRAAMASSPPQSPEPRRYEDPLLQSLQSDGEGDALDHSHNNWLDTTAGRAAHANGTATTKQQQQFTLGSVSTEARSRLFTQFKSSTAEGCTVCDNIQEARAAARELRTLARSKAGEVNAAKRTIDELQRALDSKRAAGGSSSTATAAAAIAATGECVMDEEEFKLVKLERDAKRTYKAAFDELRALRQGSEAAQSQVDALKLELLSLFEEWAARRGAAESSSSSGAALLLDSTNGNSSGDYRSPAWDGAAVARTTSNSSSTDKLDENELFESMEVERQDPEAVAFFQAQKNAQATRSQNTLALRQMHRSKRYK
jgi:hypothetical protein